VRKTLGAIRHTDMTIGLFNPLFYFDRLKDLIQFIIAPKQDIKDFLSNLDKVTSTIFLVLVTLFFSLSSHFAIYYFFDPRPTLSYMELPSKYGQVGFFFFSVALVPLVEEIYYRLPLKFNSIFISISFGIFSYRFLSNHYFHVQYYSGDLVFSRVAFAATLTFMVYLIVSRQRIEPFLRHIWTKYFKFIFYAICCMFAWGHIHNFQSSSYTILLIPIFTLPQFFLGLTSGFVRMKYGFFYAFLLHACYNSSSYWLPF
jgi:uncharacterized protein